MKHRMSRRRPEPQPSVADPRPHLLRAVLAFVQSARSTPGVRRIALLGSLATNKPVPKYADVLVTIDATIDLDLLARLGRRLKGTAQTINLGADVFLANEADRYMGASATTASATHAWPAARSAAHLNDDLQIVTLTPALVSAPPIDLWPRMVARCAVPVDTQALLVAKLQEDEVPSDWSVVPGGSRVTP